MKFYRTDTHDFDFDVGAFEIAEDGTFTESEWPEGITVVRFQERCDTEFHYRVEESSPEFHGHRWNGAYSVDEDDNRKPGDLMMEEACPFHEETIRVPIKEPLLINWKRDLVPFVIALHGAPDEGSAYVTAIDDKGRFVARGPSDNSQARDRGDPVQALDHVRLLLAPGRYQFRAESGTDPIARGSVKATVPVTQADVQISMTVR